MSQNSNTLMLFFAEQSQHDSCVLAIVNLMRGDEAKSLEWQERLGVNLSSHWHEDWFNHDFRAQPEFVLLSYDSSTSATLPLELLRQLFEHGLKAAVLEVFHSQVGETQRHHFLAGVLVNRHALYEHEPQVQACIAREMDADSAEVADETGNDVCVAKPVPLQRLIDDERKQQAQAREMVEGIVELSKIARESGSSPLGLMKGAMVLWAIGKGLLHAVIFTVVTLVLFKGLWLWIGLGLLLAIVLPLLYASQALGEFAEPKVVEAE